MYVRKKKKLKYIWYSAGNSLSMIAPVRSKSILRLWDEKQAGLWMHTYFQVELNLHFAIYTECEQ